MDLKQLRALLAIAETGSVTRAAELLHIVQPAVSRQLHMLEEDLGTPLFQRGRHGMEPTEAGAVLIERARRALRELDMARDEIRPTPGTLAGQVAVGLLPSTGELLAGPLVRRLKENHPKLQVSIAVGYAGHLKQWLEVGDIDVALLYDVEFSPISWAQPLLNEQLYLVGPPGAGLSGDRPIPLKEAATRPLVLPMAPHGIRIVFERACAAAELKLCVTAQTNAMAVQKGLVMQGQGCTVLPGVAIYQDVARGALCAAPIVEPDLCRTVVLARSATRRMSAQVRVLHDALYRQVRDEVAQRRWPHATWLAGDPAVEEPSPRP